MAHPEESQGREADIKLHGSVHEVQWQLQCDRDVAIQAFVSLNKTFDIKNLGGGFSNSDEARAARNVVDKAFKCLCATHGKLVAETHGSWIDIAAYKPAYMDDHRA